ncbi:hypothetical protein BD769DRAFT_1553153, partial [Suillus cothurnatus]
MTDSQVICGILDAVPQIIVKVCAHDNDMDMKDGISLLSLKHHPLLSYLQSLRTPASSPFGTVDRKARGSGAGDVVDSMIESRAVLERIKLIRVAAEGKDVLEVFLAFRPNPQNLVHNEQHSDEDRDARSDVGDPDGIYRPPKLAPMPYTEIAVDKRSKRQPVPKALSTLLHQDPSRPHVEDFEVENFTRLVTKKKDARRRRKDEEDLALGGTGTGMDRKRGRGLEDEFADVLHSVGRTKKEVLGDGYEELRQKGKKADALSRSRTTRKGDFEGADDDGIFEKAKMTLHKIMKARKR